MTTKSYYFNAQPGERIRVAAAWYSQADCSGSGTPPGSSNCASDALLANLDLSVIDPITGIVLADSTGQPTLSNSVHNSYELLPEDGDLIIPTNGPADRIYEIRVTRPSSSPSSEPNNILGVAIVKLPITSPAVASWAVGRLDMFVAGGDQALWHKWYDSAGWSTWERLDGVVWEPAAVSWGYNRIDVVVRGGDNAIYHRAWDGSAWTPWQSLGSVATGGPAIASRAAGQLDVLARGADGGLQRLTYQSGSWGTWGSILSSGSVLGDPDAVSQHNGTIDVVVQGAFDVIRQTRWTGSAWTSYTTAGELP